MGSLRPERKSATGRESLQPRKGVCRESAAGRGSPRLGEGVRGWERESAAGRGSLRPRIRVCDRECEAMTAKGRLQPWKEVCDCERKSATIKLCWERKFVTTTKGSVLTKQCRD